jgi:hypothetical protein
MQFAYLTKTPPFAKRRIQRRIASVCVYNSSFTAHSIHYQLNSCLSRIYLGYQPKSGSKMPSQRFWVNLHANINTAADLTGNATFLIQAKAAQDGPASFTGQVFDDKSKPLAGIKVSLGRTALVSTTNDEGKFELNNIPPGRIDLFIDGRTYNPTLDAARAQYPSLHFEAYAVKGRINQIAHPIYLPPLATSADSAKQVGGNTDVILTIPGLAGFSMKVKANSVTFPDGSKTGLLIVSPVTADKLPMSPPGGAARFGVPAWTIQPAGTRFDPPIEVTLPNYQGRLPGDTLPIVQWDHDLGQYVGMGIATVSEDGAVMVCDSGGGVTKAGWGGGPPPDPPKCGQKAPPDCKNLCESAQTRPDEDCPTCLPDTKLIGKKDIEISAGVGPYQFDFKVRELPIPIFQTPKISTYGSLQGKMEIQDECCAGGSRGVKKGRRYAFKGTAEVGFEGQLKIARFPIIVTAKAAAAGSVLLEIDACEAKPPVNGELEALGELRFALGAYDEDDIKLNLISAAGIGKGKTKWTKEGSDLVVAGTFEVDGEVTLLQFKLLGLALAGVTIKFSRYESTAAEIYRKGIFP